MSEHEQNLEAIRQQALSAGLTVPLHSPGDSLVVRASAEAKAELATLIKSATKLKLRNKWLNDGTLVCIAIPTRALTSQA
jgi:hypothetical protein